MWSRKVFLAASTFFIILYLIFFFSNYSSLIHQSFRKLSVSSVPHRFERAAVVYIAFKNDKYLSWACTSISTLREFGNFWGRIYVLTDRDSYSCPDGSLLETEATLINPAEKNLTFAGKNVTFTNPKLFKTL